MSKRIVILVKGKFVFEDNITKNLDYLDNDIELISKTLRNYGQWEMSNVIELENPQDIIDALTAYSTYDEILFYYTGHGDTNASNRFVLVGKNDKKICLKDALDNSKNYIKKCRLTLVIDACRSGYLLEEGNKPQLECEIFTATDLGKAYKTVDKDISYFTNLVCMYIEEEKGKPLYLDKISTYVEKESKKSFEEDIQKKQSPQYIDIGRNSKHKSIIAHQTDIKSEQPFANQELFLTIELQHKDKNLYYMYIWEKWEAPNGHMVLKNISPTETTYTKDEIPLIIDTLRREKYPQIKIKNIFLTFILPSKLMTEKINFWELENGNLFGSEYNILLRGRERFVTEDENKNRTYYDIQKWHDNWDEYIDKRDERIHDACCPIDCNDDEKEITSTEVAETPFALIHYSPTVDSFKNLYKSGFPLIMWINDCQDFTKFKEIFSQVKFQEIKLGELHTKLSKFKPRHTGVDRDTSIMLIYDDPNFLPYDEKSPNLTIPKRRKNE